MYLNFFIQSKSQAPLRKLAASEASALTFISAGWHAKSGSVGKKSSTNNSSGSNSSGKKKLAKRSEVSY